MKVLFIQNTIMGYRLPFYRALVQQIGFEVRVVCSEISCTSFEDRFEVKQIELFRIGPLNFQKGLSEHLRWADVVVAMFDLRWPAGIILPVLRRKRRNLVLWGHGYGRSGIGRVVRTLLMKVSAAVVFYSGDGAAAALHAGVPGRKVFVAPNTMFCGNSEDLSLVCKDTFLYVGRIQERKRLDLLVEAYRKYREKGGSHKLTIVGDGPYKQTLLDRVRSLGLGRDVIFNPGTFDEALLKQYFSKAVAYVSPGDVGLGVLHSFAYAVPVLTCYGQRHGPEVSWVIDRYNGLFCAPGVHQISSMLIYLSKSPADQRALARNAYHTYSEKVSPQHMLEGFKEAIKYASHNGQEP